jgi:hypothetical protein
MCLPLCDLVSVNVLRQGPAGSVQVDIHEKRQAKKTTNKREPLHPHLQPAALAAAVSSTVALAEPAAACLTRRRSSAHSLLLCSHSTPP